MLLHKHWLCRCAIIVGIILTTNLMSAQRISNSPSGDSLKFREKVVQLLSQEIGLEATDLAKDYGLLETINLSEIVPFLEIEQSTDSIVEKDIFKWNRAQISLQNTYSNLQTQQLSQDPTGLYSNLSGTANATITDLPFSLNGRLILRDAKVDNQLSNFRISFNPKEFINNYKSKLLDAKGTNLLNIASKDNVKKDLDKRVNDLSAREIEILRTEVKFQILQSIITSPKYSELLSAKDREMGDLVKLRDSVEVLTVSIEEEIREVQDSLQHMKRKTNEKIAEGKNRIAQLRIDDKMARAYVEDSIISKIIALDTLQTKVLQIQTSYQDAWQERKDYYGDSLNVVKSKLNKYKELDAKSEVKALQNELIQTDSLPFLLKLAALTDKFEIGQSNLDGNWYTAQNLPIKGIQYGATFGDWKTEVAFGKQVYNTAFTTIWNSDFFTKANGASVNYANIGYAVDSTLALSIGYLRMKNEGFTDGLFLELPYDNEVISLDSELTLFKRATIKGNINFSMESFQSNIENTNPTFDNKEAFAGELTIGANVIKNISLEVGYFHIDKNYSTRGNPFIQPNRSGIVAKLIGQVKDKLDFGIDLRYGESIDTSLVLSDNQKNLEFLGYFNYTINNNWLLSAQVSPNTFKYFGSGDVNYSGSNTIYNAQLTNQHQLGSIQSITTVGFTNFNSELTYADTAVVNISDQIFAQNTLQFSQSSSVSTLLMYGLNSGNSLEEPTVASTSLFFQMDYGYQSKKIGVSIGGQYLKNYVAEGTLFGIANSLIWQFSPDVALDISANYQFSLTDNADNRIWAAIGLKKEF